MPGRKIFYLLFFLSGFSALIYEVVWARQLGLIFGNTTYAISTILTVFFSGLALGSYVVGRMADHANGKRMTIARINANPSTGSGQVVLMVIYALIELVIGIYAALTPLIFKLIEVLQVSLSQQFNPSYSGFSFITFGLAFLGLILPTILMGGTLPVMSRFLVSDQHEGGQIMGNLYGLNTLGGVGGVLLAGFWLIPTIGVRETVWLAAGINLLIGGIVVFYANTMRMKIVQMHANSQHGKQSISINSQYLNSHKISIFASFVITGFASLALEVLWTRVLILVFGSSTYAFTIILAVFLLGIALGSFVASKFLLKRENLLVWLVSLQLLVGLGVVLATPFFDKLPFLFLQNFKGTFESNLWMAFLISFLMVLPLTILMGMIFPLGIRLVASRLERMAADLGKLYSLNTFGAILGSFAAGFIIIPLLGIQKGIILSGSLYALASLIILFTTFKPLKLKYLIPVSLISIFVSSHFFSLSPWNKEILSSGVYMYYQQYLESNDPVSVMKGREMVFYKEGLSSTVAVMRDDEGLFLRVNGKTDASALGDLPTELLIGHLPILLHPNPKSVLVIGLGSGITLGAVEQYPVEKIDMVEIEPAIVEAAKFFEKDNHNALADNRVDLSVADGRHFLLTSKDKYDVISSEPSNPWVKGNSDLFSKEYFQSMKAHLKDDGVALQWLQYYRMDPESLKAVLATFRSVFPNMSVWSPSVNNDLLLIGTSEPLVIDFQLLEKKVSEEKVKEDLARISMDKATKILGLYLFDGETVRQKTEGAKVHTDNKPVLEFSAGFNLTRMTRGQNADLFLQVKEEPFSFVSNISEKQKEEVRNYLAMKDEILLGKTAFSEGNLTETLTHYEEALKRDPGRKPLQWRLLRLYLGQATAAYFSKNLPQAKKSLLKALEIDNNYFKAHLNLGTIYYEEGNFPEAAQEWALAKEIDPDNEQVEQNLQLLEKYFPGE